MTCEICGNKKVIMENKELPICPRCNGLKIVNKELAMTIADAQIKWFENAFSSYIKRFKKKRLLVWLLAAREGVFWQFINEPSISLSRFLAYNVLIKEVMGLYHIEGSEDAEEKNTEHLISTFSDFVNIRNRRSLIKEEFGYYIAKEDFDCYNIDHKTLMSNFVFVHCEDWLPIFETLEQNDITDEKSAAAYMQKHKTEYEKARSTPYKIEYWTPKERIRRLYRFFETSLAAIHKNEIFVKTFDFGYLKKNGITPEMIFKLANVPSRKGLLTKQTRTQFRVQLKRTGRKDIMNMYKLLVFGPNNKDVFPLFVELDEKEDTVLISPGFIYLIHLVYYPIYYQDLFVAETLRLSDKFEKEDVPEMFRKNGFNVRNNIVDKKKSKLEIDTLAWKESVLYVIETKIWGIKSYYETRKRQVNSERDVKGIIEGKKYHIKDNKLVEDKVPSLLSKIAYVKENLAELCPDHKKIKEIRGLIVTRIFPPINEYNDVKIINFSDIKKLNG
ncbi:MAG: hypothetical protein PHY95_00220 [Candidatus ainarchaeum sp.]|nr:hypothetical protein [Candidatus ainarchaeum sp.]